MVGFCGSRALPASAEDSALVSGVVGSVLAAFPRRGVAVGCAVGGDALVVSSALALGASSRLRVFAAFGPVCPPWPAPASLLPARLPLSPRSPAWQAPSPPAPPSPGGPGAVPRSPSPGASSPARLALVSAVAASGAGRGFVGFVSSSCPAGLIPVPFALGLLLRVRVRIVGLPRARLGPRLPVVVFPVGAQASAGPESVFPVSWGSWVPLASSGSDSAWTSGFRLGPASPALFGR